MGQSVNIRIQPIVILQKCFKLLIRLALFLKIYKSALDFAGPVCGIGSVCVICPVCERYLGI